MEGNSSVVVWMLVTVGAVNLWVDEDTVSWSRCDNLYLKDEGAYIYSPTTSETRRWDAVTAS